jgi:hypothetical protein
MFTYSKQSISEWKADLSSGVNLERTITTLVMMSWTSFWCHNAILSRHNHSTISLAHLYSPIQQPYSQNVSYFISMSEAQLIRVTVCARRNPKLTEDEFNDHWANKHGPLISAWLQTHGCVKYIQVRPSCLISKSISSRVFRISTDLIIAASLISISIKLNHPQSLA